MKPKSTEFATIPWIAATEEKLTAPIENLEFFSFRLCNPPGGDWVPNEERHPEFKSERDAKQPAHCRGECAQQLVPAEHEGDDNCDEGGDELGDDPEE